MQWHIIEGSAKVTLDNESLVLESDRSVRISDGKSGKLENTGDTQLQLIEVAKLKGTK
jgi:mannose-6-phosphate isomerase-like protein (cupin superfamily)